MEKANLFNLFSRNKKIRLKLENDQLMLGKLLTAIQSSTRLYMTTDNDVIASHPSTYQYSSLKIVPAVGVQ